MAKLKKWKAEKALQKRIEAKNKKPVFKIGVPHHNFYSPTTKDPPKPHCHRHVKKEVPSEPKKISRATERRLALKAQAAAAAAASSSETGKTPIAKRTRSRKNATKTAAAVIPPKEKSIVPSFAPENYVFKKPPGIESTYSMPLFGQIPIPIEPDTPKELHTFKFTTFSTDTKTDNVKKVQNSKESDEEESIEAKKLSTESNSDTENDNVADSTVESIKLRLSSQGSLDSNKDENVTPKITSPVSNKDNKKPDILAKCILPVAAQFSPFIVTSRGKSSARKEMKKRLSLRTSCSPIDADVPTKDTVMQSLNISVDEEENTAQYYKSLAQREENRLKDLSNEWKEIQNSSTLPEEAIYHINSATGQANLLINKKFSRFQQLVVNCEDGKGEMLVRCRDLQGFWELIKREIADCDSRFTKLHTLQSNNWIEEEDQAVEQIVKKKTVVKKKKNTAKSSMKSFIEAQRKKKLQEQMEIDTENNENIEKNTIKPPQIETPKKNNLLSINNTKTDSPKLTPKTSLLRRVQLSESAKKLALASMKITQTCKTPEVELDQSIVYVNSHQTPGKGILKKVANFPKNENRLIKSCKVNFNETIDTKEAPNDDESFDQNNTFTVDSLKTDSIDLEADTNDQDKEEEEEEPVNKKLTFDDNIASPESDSVFEESPSPSKENISKMHLTPHKNDTQSLSSRPVYPSVEIISPTPVAVLPVLNITSPTPVKKTLRRSKFNQEEIDDNETPPPTRKLRSRSINVDFTPSDKSKSDKLDLTDKENSGQKRKSTRRSKKNETNHLEIPSTPRKSNRLSMKQQTDDDCAACSVIMPGTPMTPRRKKRTENTHSCK